MNIYDVTCESFLFLLVFMSTSVACALAPSINRSSTDFSFQNLVFKNLFEFSAIEIT